MTGPADEFRTRILIVDDDRKLCGLIAEYLDPFGYEVESRFTGQEGLEAALEGDYHAVILDVMMPDLDGFEVLKRLRRESDIPVLMLTARGDETDRIVGLEIGADDYLPKTFSTRELLARLRAVTRRAIPQKETDPEAVEKPLVLGPLRIEPSARIAVLNEAVLALTTLEFDLLLALARAAGRVLSRNQLLNAVAERDHDVFDRSIDVHVSALRRKLGDDSRAPHFIKTVRGVGYLLLKSPGEPS